MYCLFYRGGDFSMRYRQFMALPFTVNNRRKQILPFTAKYIHRRKKNHHLPSKYLLLDLLFYHLPQKKCLFFAITIKVPPNMTLPLTARKRYREHIFYRLRFENWKLPYHCITVPFRYRLQNRYRGVSWFFQQLLKQYIVERLFFHELLEMNHAQKEPEIHFQQYVKYTINRTTSVTVQGHRSRALVLSASPQNLTVDWPG